MMSISSAKVTLVQEKLLDWYANNGRKFPWRDDGLTDFQYVIAEVLLQPTKAETVAKFYLQFLKDFPSWYSLADSDVESIEKYLIPIGLYRQRSKRLKSLAQEQRRAGHVT